MTTSSGVIVSTSMTCAPTSPRNGSRRAACSARNDLGRIAVGRPMFVGRVEPLGEDVRPGVEPDDDDTRGTHRDPCGRIVDHARRGADDARSGGGQRVEELGGLASVHRVDALAIAQLADGRAGRCLDVGVGIAPRPAEPCGELAPHGRLAGAHQPGDHDVLDSAHRHRVAAYTRAHGTPLTARAAGGHRHPWRRTARADARPGGARDGLSDRGPRPGSRLPGGGRRRSAGLRLVRRRRGGAAAGRAERRRDLRAGARRGGGDRGDRGDSSPSSRPGRPAARCW